MSDNNDQNQSSVTEHLLELRSRIIKSLIFFSIAFIISYMNADKIYDFLLQPRFPLMTCFCWRNLKD